MPRSSWMKKVQLDPKKKVPLDINLASVLQNESRKTMRDIEYRYSDLVRMKVISRINTFLQTASYSGSGSDKKKYIHKKDWFNILWDVEKKALLCPIDTANRWWREAQTGKFKASPKTSGTKRKMTIEVCKLLVKIVESLPSATLEEYRGLLYAHTGVLVSEGTVSDYVNKHLKLTRKRINREKMHKFSPANTNYYYHYVHIFKQLNINVKIVK